MTAEAERPDDVPESEGGRPTRRANFVVVANRLPVDRVEHPDGTTTWRTSPGGLVTALEPVMHSHHGAWVGWHGAPDEVLDPFENDELELVPVPLSASEVEDYYEGFSNATLWPLYHDVVAPPVFDRGWWDSYVTINERFAAAAQPAFELAGRREMPANNLMLLFRRSGGR